MLRQAVVFLMSANPFPKEAVFYEMPDSAVMGAHTRRPVFTESLCFETKSPSLPASFCWLMPGGNFYRR